MEKATPRSECLKIIDMEHYYHHKHSQRLEHNVCNGYYISSAYLGYHWKGDHIRFHFETLVYRFRTEPTTLKRVIIAPIKTYCFKDYEKCIDHHHNLMQEIFQGIFQIDDYA